jgi:hypothetical protein
MRQRLQIIVRLPVAVVIPDIRVEDRGLDGALVAGHVIAGISHAGALQLVQALGVLVVFGEDVGTPLVRLALSVDVEEKSGECGDTVGYLSSVYSSRIHGKYDERTKINARSD